MKEEWLGLNHANRGKVELQQGYEANFAVDIDDLHLNVTEAAAREIVRAIDQAKADAQQEQAEQRDEEPDASGVQLD